MKINDHTTSQSTDVIFETERRAKELIDSEKRATKSIADALREVFEENGKTGRFIDVSRVPLICQNISGIHDSLKEMKDMINNFNDSHVSNETFWPVKTIVYSGVGITLVAVIGAILTLIVKK